MYEQFYSLKEKPFSLTPDPEFLFVNQDYQSALDQVLYGIKRREGFTVIAGDVGTGKTTLCWALLGRLEKDLQTALILNPLLTAEDMLRAILQDFGIKSRRLSLSAATTSPAAGDPGWMQGMTRKELIDELNFFLLERAQEDVFCVLIIDEAQDLSMEVLEQLRLLSNLETSKKKLLQIIFVGQIEFNEKLKSQELRSLNQRISIRYELRPLSAVDTARYVAHRLKIAGASNKLQFTAGAVKEVYRYSRGYPRLVNLICDRALLAGYSERAWTITGKIVRKAVAGLRGGPVQKLTGWLQHLRLFGRVMALIAVALLAVVLFLGWRRMNPSASDRAGLPPAQAPAVQASVAPTPAAQPVPAERTAVPGTVAPLVAIPERPGVQDEPEAGRYHVQVHSFLIQEQAASAVERLRTLGYAAEVRTQARRNGTQWFVVVVGPFQDLESAQDCAAGLRRNAGASPIIVRTRA